MGDIRRIRNAIIHDNSKITPKLISELEFLTMIWDLKPGKLVVTEKMIHSLLEQINAIRLRVRPNP